MFSFFFFLNQRYSDYRYFSLAFSVLHSVSVPGSSKLLNKHRVSFCNPSKSAELLQMDFSWLIDKAPFPYHRPMPGELWTFFGRRGRETAIWWEPPSTSTLESGSEEVREQVQGGLVTEEERERLGQCLLLKEGNRKSDLKYGRILWVN